MGIGGGKHTIEALCGLLGLSPMHFVYLILIHILEKASTNQLFPEYLLA